MTPAAAATQLDIYQHDSSTKLQFVLRGELAGMPVEYLEHAWVAAASTLGRRELVVDLSGVSGVDRAGMELLSRMREKGARLTAPWPPVSPELLRSVGIPAAPPGRPGGRRWGDMARWLGRALRIRGLEKRGYPLAADAPLGHS